MKRSFNLRRYLAGAWICLSLGLPFVADGQGTPNFLVIMTDQQAWDAVGYAGNQQILTPHLDRLAAEGLRFEQFYVNSPICSPSRTAISTGQYPQRWRITSYLNNRANNEQRGMAQWLDPQAPMLARMRWTSSGLSSSMASRARE